MQHTKAFKIPLLLFFTLGMGNLTTHYWQEFGPARIVPHESLYANLNQSVKFDKNPVKGDVTVIVTSAQETKVQACKEIFKSNSRFKDASISYETRKVDSDIAPQPLGEKAAERGAINRINNIRKNEQITNNAFFCSIESFFTKPTVHEPRDHAMIVIVDPHNRVYRYISDGVMIEPSIYDIALESGGLSRDGTGALKTIGEVLSDKYHVDPHNWHTYVTQDKYSRYDQIISAFDESNLF